MRFFAAMLLTLALAGCTDNVVGSHYQSNRRELPTVNLPAALRQENWRGSLREGSCVHATLVSLFRWQGRPKTAEWWRRNHGNGESVDTLGEQLDAAGIRYAQTFDANDVAFLEWAIATCRGAGVTVLGGRHFVALVHLDSQWAGILDPNDTRRILFVPRDTFLAEWQNSNSWAVALIYTPSPPLPYGPS